MNHNYGLYFIVAPYVLRRLNGGYESIAWGNPNNALVDFTGGISEVIGLKGKRSSPGDLFDVMYAMTQKCSMLSCGFQAIMTLLHLIMVNILISKPVFTSIHPAVAVLRHRQSSTSSLRRPPSARRATTLPRRVWSSGLLCRLELSTSSPP